MLGFVSRIELSRHCSALRPCHQAGVFFEAAWAGKRQRAASSRTHRQQKGYYLFYVIP
jgi:hypothetical protein